jgi:hypothetical protein
MLSKKFFSVSINLMQNIILDYIEIYLYIVFESTAKELGDLYGNLTKYVLFKP